VTETPQHPEVSRRTAFYVIPAVFKMAIFQEAYTVSFQSTVLLLPSIVKHGLGPPSKLTITSLAVAAMRRRGVATVFV
jgi:hypothetical protein